MPAEIDIVAYLQSKGLQVKRANGPEVIVACWFCGEPPDSRKKKMYVNTEDGWFDCKVCGEHGGTTLLQRAFGDDPVTNRLPGSDPAVRKAVLNESTMLAEAWLGNADDVMLYLLNERGLSPETIVERRLGYVPPMMSLVGCLNPPRSKDDLVPTGLVYRDGPRVGQDFFYHHITIPYVSRRSVSQLRGRQWGHTTGGKYMTGPGEDVLLYNLDDLDDADEAVIVEGEFDCMALKQHLQTSPDPRVRRIAVVGLAGANGFTEGAERYFENCKRVFVALDPDDTGKREAVKIKEKLGSRGRIVELPPELPKCDWSEYLLPIPADADAAWHIKHAHAGHTWADAVALFGNAAGKRLYNAGEAGQSWRQNQNAHGGYKTGYSQIDATILPGLLPGQVMVFLAKTGTGKTVVLCNLAVNMLNRKVLFISLEMTKEEVYVRLRRIYLHNHPNCTDAEMEQALSNVLICDENRLSEKDFALLIDEYEQETGERPELVFVDYLGYYARGQKGASMYEKVTNAVMQLKAEAKAHKVAIITPHQVNRLAKEGKPIDLADARDSGAVEETGDFVISIWRPDDALVANSSDGNQMHSGRLKMTILKSRHGGKDRTYTFVMDLLTLRIVEIEDVRGSKKVEHHNHLHWRGHTWEQMRRDETAPRQMALVGT